MSLLLVTGASRGLGRAFALEAANSLSLSHIALISRDKDGLHETQHAVSSQSPSVAASVHVVDFAEIDTLEASFRSILAQFDPSKYHTVYLLNNHGVLGVLDKLRNQTNLLETVKKSIDVNLTSAFITTSLVLQHFPSSSPTSPKLFLVNISSLAAIKAFPCWSLYASVKAARDMLYSVVALEEDAHNIKTLSYAPGPCDTDMQTTLRTTLADTEMREIYSNMHKNGQLVEPGATARVLMKVLLENKFVSGSHVDYYDVKSD